MCRDFARLYCDSCKQRQPAAFAYNADIVARLRERLKNAHLALRSELYSGWVLPRDNATGPQLMAAALLTRDL